MVVQLKTILDSEMLVWYKTCLLILPSVTHGPPVKYVKLRAAHAPGMPGTFSLPPRVSDPDMHNGTCVTYVP